MKRITSIVVILTFLFNTDPGWAGLLARVRPAEDGGARTSVLSALPVPVDIPDTYVNTGKIHLASLLAPTGEIPYLYSVPAEYEPRITSKRSTSRGRTSPLNLPIPANEFVLKIQGSMADQAYPYPLWLFGSAAIYGVRANHDIDIAIPVENPLKDEERNKFNSVIRAALSLGENEHWWGHFPSLSWLLEPDKTPLKHGIVYRITSREIMTITDIEEFEKLARADLLKHTSQDRTSPARSSVPLNEIMTIYTWHDFKDQVSKWSVQFEGFQYLRYPYPGAPGKCLYPASDEERFKTASLAEYFANYLKALSAIEPPFNIQALRLKFMEGREFNILEITPIEDRDTGARVTNTEISTSPAAAEDNPTGKPKKPESATDATKIGTSPDDQLGVIEHGMLRSEAAKRGLVSRIAGIGNRVIDIYGFHGGTGLRGSDEFERQKAMFERRYEALVQSLGYRPDVLWVVEDYLLDFRFLRVELQRLFKVDPTPFFDVVYNSYNNGRIQAPYFTRDVLKQIRRDTHFRKIIELLERLYRHLREKKATKINQLFKKEGNWESKLSGALAQYDVHSRDFFQAYYHWLYETPFRKVYEHFNPRHGINFIDSLNILLDGYATDLASRFWIEGKRDEALRALRIHSYVSARSNFVDRDLALCRSIKAYLKAHPRSVVGFLRGRGHQLMSRLLHPERTFDYNPSIDFSDGEFASRLANGTTAEMGTSVAGALLRSPLEIHLFALLDAFYREDEQTGNLIPLQMLNHEQMYLRSRAAVEPISEVSLDWILSRLAAKGYQSQYKSNIRPATVFTLLWRFGRTEDGKILVDQHCTDLFITDRYLFEVFRYEEVVSAALSAYQSLAREAGFRTDQLLGFNLLYLVEFAKRMAQNDRERFLRDYVEDKFHRYIPQLLAAAAEDDPRKMILKMKKIFSDKLVFSEENIARILCVKKVFLQLVEEKEESFLPQPLMYKKDAELGTGETGKTFKSNPGAVPESGVKPSLNPGREDQNHSAPDRTSPAAAKVYIQQLLEQAGALFDAALADLRRAESPDIREKLEALMQSKSSDIASILEEFRKENRARILYRLMDEMQIGSEALRKASADTIASKIKEAGVDDIEAFMERWNRTALDSTEAVLGRFRCTQGHDVEKLLKKLEATVSQDESDRFITYVYLWINMNRFAFDLSRYAMILKARQKQESRSLIDKFMKVKKNFNFYLNLANAFVFDTERWGPRYNILTLMGDLDAFANRAELETQRQAYQSARKNIERAFEDVKKAKTWIEILFKLCQIINLLDQAKFKLRRPVPIVKQGIDSIVDDFIEVMWFVEQQKYDLAEIRQMLIDKKEKIEQLKPHMHGDAAVCHGVASRELSVAIKNIDRLLESSATFQTSPLTLEDLHPVPFAVEGARLQLQMHGKSMTDI